MPEIAYYRPDKKLAIAKNIYRTPIKDLFYLKYPKFIDERGYFSQVLEPTRICQQINANFQIKQVNLSVSKTKVLRGIHAENWNKLITVLNGRAQLVVADIRKDSVTYKKLVYFDFNADSKSQWGESLYIGAKLGNSICAIQGPVYYLYGVDQLYQDRKTSDDQAIYLFDPDLNINWPFSQEEMIISQRDLDSISLKELEEKD
jgi:dTDP-4-dehydrorhamnose 3,5-epimerase